MEKAKKKEMELHRELAKKYRDIREKNVNSRYYDRIWVRKILDMPTKGCSNVLDYGCGTCLFYPELLRRNKDVNYLGVDLSADMLEVAKKKYKGIKVIRADAEKLPMKRNSYDLVIGRGILHHLPNPKKGVKEIYNVLKPGCEVVISETSTNVFLNFLRRIAYKKKGHFSEEHKAFKYKELVGLFEKNGFKVKRTEGFGYLAFPFGFPDIMPSLASTPYFLFRILVFIDSVLSKIPFVKRLSWHTIVLAEKE